MKMITLKNGQPLVAVMFVSDDYDRPAAIQHTALAGIPSAAITGEVQLSHRHQTLIKDDILPDFPYLYKENYHDR